MVSMFEQASYFTFDAKVKEILINCAKNKFPQQFKLVNGKIITMNNESYDVPSDPMDLCNLVQDILLDRKKLIIKPIPVSSRSSKLSEGTLELAIYAFCIRETKIRSKDQTYTNRLFSCIYTGLYIGKLKDSDFQMDSGSIIHINNLNLDSMLFDI